MSPANFIDHFPLRQEGERDERGLEVSRDIEVEE